MALIEEISLPRVFDENLSFLRVVSPIKLSVTLSIVPLSYASMQLPRGETLPARGYVEIYTSMGSVGFFRVRSPQESYGEDITTSELEHAIVEVGDYLVLNDYNEMMSAQTAMQTVFSHYRGNKWQLGSVSALGSGEIALQVDHDRVLEAMIAILDQKPDCMMAFNFNTSPWTVSIVSRGTTVTAEGRLSRNVNAAKVSYDDTELVTRCYYDYSTTNAQTGEPSTAWAYIDASTMSQYGLVERVAPSGGNYTQPEALKAAQVYLEKHKNPRVSVTISAEELSSVTGEAYDTFTIGKLYRLALSDYNVTVEKNVTGLTWNDVFDAPHDITVNLDEEEDTAITFLHDLDAKGGAGGGGGGARKQEEIWKEYRTHFDMTDYYIDMWARHVATNEDILEQAGLYLDSNGVLVYADDNANMWASKLKVESDRISLVVTGTGANAAINPASIVAAINAQTGQSTVKISADKISLSGTVIADLIEGEDIAVGSLSANTIASDAVNTGDITLAGYIAKGGSYFGTYSLKVDNVEKAKFLGTADVNFDRAAARAEGAAAVVVTLDTGSWTAVDSSTGDYQRTVIAKKDNANAATSTISAQQVWNLGWNAARAWMLQHSHTCLTGYSTYNNGTSSNLYRQDSSVPGGFAVATGAARVWRYGGSTTTYYELPSAK